MAGFGFAPALALAGVSRRDVVAVVRFAALPDFAAAVLGAADPAERVPRADLPEVAADLDVPVFADEDVVLADRDLPVPEAVRDGAADLLVLAGAAGLATDIALAAAVSDFEAAVMALVAVFIACMAVDMVLAEDVAFVAAAVILVAAFVTLVAADDTVRAAVLADGAVLDAGAAGRVVPPAAAPPRRDVLLLADLLRLLLAALRLAVVRVVVRAGTDLPPS